MKNTIIFSIIVFMIFGCNSRDSRTNNQVNLTHFDTIVVNQYEEHQQFFLRDSIYSRLNTSEIIDSIRANICEFRGIHKLGDREFSFGYPRGKKYNSSNIPLSVYKMIFGNEKSELDINHYSNIKIDSVKEKVYMHKGLTIKDNRKYKYLLSMLEKDDYIQFLFTANGKYTPQIFLITSDKSSLKKIDELKVFRSFRDVDEYDIIHTNFYDDFNKLSKTEIKNNEKDYYKIDTIYTNFTISKFGKIEEN